MAYLKSALLIAGLIIQANFAHALSVKEGDIIGESQIRYDPSTIIFEAATSSRFGHVGIIFKDKGQWLVYESSPPEAQIETLEDFMKHNKGAYAIIRKQQALTSKELATIKKVAAGVVANKVPYNHTMVLNSESLNCSEFVRGVFAKANIEVGRIEKIADLNTNAFKGMMLNMASEMGPIPMDGKVVTPVSVMQTAGWSKVEGPLELKNNYTDLELFNQWKQEGITKFLTEAVGISENELGKLATP